MALSRPAVLVSVVTLALISIVLTIFAYVAPEFYNHNNISLIAIFPTAVPGSATVPATDGPTVLLGIYGMEKTLLFPKY
jgi:hypothetical protein